MFSIQERWCTSKKIVINYDLTFTQQVFFSSAVLVFGLSVHVILHIITYELCDSDYKHCQMSFHHYANNIISFVFCFFQPIPAHGEPYQHPKLSESAINPATPSRYSPVSKGMLGDDEITRWAFALPISLSSWSWYPFAIILHLMAFG